MANKLVSIVPSGTSNYLTPSLSFNRTATDFFYPGVIGVPVATSGVGPMTGSFGTSAQGSPNMTVAVNSGTAYVNATPSGGTAQTYAVTMDASENVTIAANSTGSTRYDFLYLVLSATGLNNPSNTALDVATLTTQRSTTQYVDSNGAPANSLLLAEITVANGAASIANASIADRRIQAKTGHTDGWSYANETWTYASATTFTVSGDVTAKYNNYDKIKLTQSGSTKYFYITGISYSSPTTTITVTGGTDYTLANATIYNNFFSKYASPNGFPQWFNFTPSYTNLTVGSGTNAGKFCINGKTVHLRFHWIYNGATMGTSPTLTLPITSADFTITGTSPLIGMGRILDSGTATFIGQLVWASTTTANLAEAAVNGAHLATSNFSATTPMTWTTNDAFTYQGQYEAA